MKFAHSAVFVVAFGVAALPIHGQSPAGPLPTFESASVKPVTEKSTGGGFGLAPGGLYRATNFSPSSLIAVAFGGAQPLHGSQVIGAPDWAATAHYDVIARAPSAVTPQEALVMLQSLLAERFSLRMHRETREQPVYVLV